MACKGLRITVTDAPTPLTPGATGVGERNAVWFKNKGTESVDIGGPDVETGEGYELEPGEGISSNILGHNDPHAVAESGHTVRVDVFGSGF